MGGRASVRTRPHLNLKTEIAVGRPQKNTISFSSSRMASSDILLPGQPLNIPRGPVPLLGGGIYSRDGQFRASLVGVPSYEGSVGVPCADSSWTNGSTTSPHHTDLGDISCTASPTHLKLCCSRFDHAIVTSASYAFDFRSARSTAEACVISGILTHF